METRLEVSNHLLSKQVFFFSPVYSSIMDQFVQKGLPIQSEKVNLKSQLKKLVIQKQSRRTLFGTKRPNERSINFDLSSLLQEIDKEIDVKQTVGGRRVLNETPRQREKTRSEVNFDTPEQHQLR